MPCPTEDVLLGFVDGQLGQADLAHVSSHLDGCMTCRAVVGASLPVRDDSDQLGRYVLRRVIGSGGMGVVYEAFDPELDRNVALKLLRPELGTQTLQDRLVAEAQALARLSHPHVVSVYDIGRAADQVFIVMELVNGLSLREWLSAASRRIDEVLEVFTHAAEGLDAAHSVGLVHRDFKPENVLITRGGRAQVSDFGLAFSLTKPPDAVDEGSAGYMAPEQRAGLSVDARSDQYSFCFSLAEATRGAAPRWLRKIIERGTQPSPERRFASMREAITALHRGRRMRVTQRVVAAIAAIVLVGGVFGAVELARRHQARASCEAEAASIDQEWSSASAATVRNAFEHTASPLATRALNTVNAGFDTYTREWRAAHVRACEATRLYGQQSEAVLAQKLSCLADRAQLFRSVRSALEGVDAPMLERVGPILQTLPPVSACDDARALAAAPAAPPSAVAREVSQARGLIGEASIAITAGHYDDGLATAQKAVLAAHATGYLPVIAEASLWAGIAHGRLGALGPALTALEEAASAAAASHVESIAVRAWVQLMHFVGFDGKRPDDGYRYNAYAESALKTMYGAAELEAERLSWLSALLADQKRFAEAQAASESQRAVVETQLGKSHRLYAVALDGLAGVLAGRGRNRDALPFQREACEGVERELGPLHPQLAMCLSNLAALNANVGEHEPSIALKLRALEMFAQLPGHPSHVAMTERNLARSYLELGSLDEAAKHLEAAEKLGKTASDQLSLLRLRGDLARARGNLSLAFETHELAAAEARKGALPAQLDPLLSLGWSALAAEQFTEADEAARQAQAVARAVYGERSFRLSEPMRLAAQSLIAQHHPELARPYAEGALQLLGDAQIDPTVLARARFALAQALTDDRPRALELAGLARQSLNRQLAEEIDAWSAGR